MEALPLSSVLPSSPHCRTTIPGSRGQQKLNRLNFLGLEALHLYLYLCFVIAVGCRRPEKFSALMLKVVEAPGASEGLSSLADIFDPVGHKLLDAEVFCSEQYIVGSVHLQGIAAKR